MIRGTTAQFKFKLPCRVDELTLAKMTFWQPSNNSFNKPIVRMKDQCSASDTDPYCLCVSLTSEETMRFSDKFKARVQIRGQYGDTTFASRQQLITVYPINDEVIEPDFPDSDEEGWIILDGKKITG